MRTKKEQDIYLKGLIEVNEVARKKNDMEEVRKGYITITFLLELDRLRKTSAEVLL